MNDDARRFLTRLEECGWFRDLPESVAEGVRERLGRGGSLTSELQAAVVSVVADSQYLLSDRPYSALLEQFAVASGGTFRPEQLSEVIQGDRTRFSFVHAGREYTLDLPAEADEPPSTFFRTLNRALADAGVGVRFFEVRELPWAPIPGFVVARPQAFAAAVARRILVGEIPEDAAYQETAGPSWRGLLGGVFGRGVKPFKKKT